jgi:hypothetical protein
MKKLTKKQIVKICENVIKEMTAAKKQGTRVYLESLIKKEIVSLEYKELYEIKIEDYIEYYTLQNAVIMANAVPDEVDGSLWWNGSVEAFDYDNRIEFMNFIKGCYESN